MYVMRVIAHTYRAAHIHMHMHTHAHTHTRTHAHTLWNPLNGRKPDTVVF